MPNIDIHSIFKMHDVTPDPYERVIGQFVRREFPRRQCGTSSELVELLSDEIFGTKLIRYGPKPSPEVQVAIRDIIRAYTSISKPIPFMVPWGSQKPDGSSIDIAEMAALKVLHGLSQRIGAHYEPGARLNVRVEDASAPYLYLDNPDAARENAARYLRDFTLLNRVLHTDQSVHLVPESSQTTEAAFNDKADGYLPVFVESLELFNLGQSFEAATVLEAIGWTGGLNPELVAYYLGQYEKLYPGTGAKQQRYRLARYFAAALARKVLKIRGDDPAWGGKFVDLSFVAPIPGTADVFARRIYYRTIPGEFTLNHIPPWRAKGFLAIAGDNEVTPKLDRFTRQDSDRYNKFTLKLEDNGLSVDLQADYILG